MWLTVNCKKNSNDDWTESELQAIAASAGPETTPPQNIIAGLIAQESEIALKIINAWAEQVNTTQGMDPKSLLNQVRRIFNPDHMKRFSFQESLSRSKTEGSGAHGASKSERRPQDSLYHALWSRIADAAGLAGFSRSSQHMKHYLGNSGTPLRYGSADVAKILRETANARTANFSKKNQNDSAEFIKNKLRLAGMELSSSEMAMITRMDRRELAFFIARLQVFELMSKFTVRNDINSAAQLQSKLQNLNKKDFPAKASNGQGEWLEYRPIGKHYVLEQSEPQSDLYFALGTFAGIYSATPVDIKVEDNQVKTRFVQSISIYDKYNWDDGKFVTLWSGWCAKLNSGNCSEIEALTSLNVGDKSIGRLHKLGMAREFEVYGKGAVSTVWDAINFRDLINPQKAKVRIALGKALTEYLMPVTDIPD